MVHSPKFAVPFAPEGLGLDAGGGVGVGAGVRVEQGLGRVGVGIGAVVGVELGKLGLEDHSLKLINAKRVKCERKFIYIYIFLDCQIMEIGHCIDMRRKQIVGLCKKYTLLFFQWL